MNCDNFLKSKYQENGILNDQQLKDSSTNYFRINMKPKLCFLFDVESWNLGLRNKAKRSIFVTNFKSPG